MAISSSGEPRDELSTSVRIAAAPVGLTPLRDWPGRALQNPAMNVPAKVLGSSCWLEATKPSRSCAHGSKHCIPAATRLANGYHSGTAVGGRRCGDCTSNQRALQARRGVDYCQTQPINPRPTLFVRRRLDRLEGLHLTLAARDVYGHESRSSHYH